MGLRNYISFDFKSDVKPECYDKHNRKLEMKIQGANEPNGLSQREWNSLLDMETAWKSGLLMIDCSLLVNVPLEKAKGLSGGWARSLPEYVPTGV